MATGDIKRIIDMVKQHDGSGSGLDADKLDGLEATKFARRDTAESVQAGFLVRRQNSTNEGGEIKLEQSSNSDLQSAISLDNYDNLVRLFATKSNGHTAGIQIDIENTPDGIHTIWHSGNDGSGSGLDADKLDDQEGSFYRNASNLNAGTVPVERLSGTYNIDISGNAATASNASKLGNRSVTAFAYSESKGNTDLNTITQSGMYRIENSNANMPSGVQYGQLLVIHGAGDTIVQIVADYHSNNIYWRSGNPSDVGGSGSWRAWQKIWHAGNDGSGSELNADKLDGQHGSYYRNASNLNAGTVPTARLSGTYNISINGNASTATNADKWDGGHKHISSANPSGGINGDVWFKY